MLRVWVLRPSDEPSSLEDVLCLFSALGDEDSGFRLKGKYGKKKYKDFFFFIIDA